MLEKYVQWLERNNAKGDALAERRGPIEDKALFNAYLEVCENGYDYISSERIRNSLTAKKLKMRHKKENITGLQIVDLLANPAYRYVRHTKGHEVRLEGMTKTITDILVRQKFDRSATGKIEGYGIKYLP